MPSSPYSRNGRRTRRRWSWRRLHQGLFDVWRSEWNRRSHVSRSSSCSCGRSRSSTFGRIGSFWIYHWPSPSASAESVRNVVLDASSPNGSGGWTPRSARATGRADGFGSGQLRDDAVPLLRAEYVVVEGPSAVFMSLRCSLSTLMLHIYCDAGSAPERMFGRRVEG